MAAPVWILSVDLQTKSATFVSGMADAAKGARGAFNDIKTGAAEAGREVGTNMMEARHGVMFLAEGFNVHLPRALATFIASIGPVGAAMEAAFPFLAIAIGAKILIEHLTKLGEEAEKLEHAQGKFETATHNAFNALDQKLLQAQIQADKLNKDYLGALKHELELINDQSLEQLVHSFDIVSKAADAVFAEIKNHWYSQGIGADGAKHALEKFRTEYDLLLSKSEDKGAHDLLAGTLASAERIRNFQKEYIGNQTNANTGKGGDGRANPDYLKFEEAALALKQAGVGVTDKEIQAQQTLVDVLNAQVKVEEKVAALKKAQSGNTTHAANNASADEAFRKFKDQEKEEERAQDEAYNRAKAAYDRTIALLQNNEREKIAATKQGSQARLQAIDAAIREEEKHGLEETAFYHSLGVQRVEAIRQMAEEEARIRAEAGKIAAEHASKMGELQIAAERETAQLLNSTRRVTAQQQAEQERQFENELYALKLAGLNKQIAALDHSDKDYENKLKSLYNRQEEMEREHQNKLSQIKDKAATEQNQKALAAMTKLVDISAHGLTDVLMRHQSFAQMMGGIEDQLLSGMVENAIKSALLMDFGKEKDAAKAARAMFIAGSHFPFPANIVAAPAMGAAAFAAVMAFNRGGEVPGIGNTDSVPAVLTPGEHVSDQELTRGLKGLVRDGGGHKTTHIQVRNTYHLSALDSGDMEDVLERHNETVTRHVERTVRRMNQ